MAYRVHEVTARGSLAFRALAPSTGEPVLITVHTGEAVVAPDVDAKTVHRRGADNAEPARIFVPNVAPLTGAERVPEVLAEMYLCGVVDPGVSGIETNSGVSDVTADYAADPRGGPARWLAVAFTCRAARGIRVGYRVTVSKPVS